MNTRRSIAAAAFLALTLPLTAQAQDVDFHGQIRPRYELRDPVGGGVDEFTSMRVRAALEAMLDDNVSVFIQLQDVRLWGEETSTLGDFNADNLDLHQGYIRYTGRKLDWLTATIGRQETNLGGQRLVGAVGWTQQGRSFDGVRLDGAGEWGGVSVLAYTLGDETASTVANDSELYGAYATVKDLGPGALDLYWLLDRVEGASETNQHSLGARYAFSGSVSGRFEGTVQTGDRAGEEVSAYMFGARLGTRFAQDEAGLTLWYDYLSGDDDLTDGEAGVFSTLFATNHKFYGFADLFLNIPVHTAGAGLTDLAVKFDWAATDRVGVKADFHSFSAAEQGSLSTAHFANEIDLSVSHRYTDHLSMTAGFSYVMQDDALAEIGRLNEDMTWFYVMLDAIF